MAESKIEESSEAVFDFIDKAFAQGQEANFIKKLKESICFELDLRLRKLTREVGKSPDISLYERLVSNLEGQILYLEDELRKKDLLIEKLIDNSLVSVNNSQPKVHTNVLTKTTPTNTDFPSYQSNNINGNKRKNDVKTSASTNTNYAPNTLINFNFDESVNSDVETLSEENSTNNVNVKKDQNKRESVYICGDSLLNGVDGDGVSCKEFCTVVKSFGGSTSLDMVDYVKPSARKKPDKLIIHVGTNDLTKGIANTNENLDLLVKTVKEISPDTQIYFSELCLRNDFQGSFSKVKLKNEELRKFCSDRNIGLVEHGNIDNSCLAKRKLHMNPKGLKRLALNFKSFLGKM